jgi:AcrR family transcriptional regulator
MTRRSRLATLYDEYLKKAPQQSRSRTIVESILAAGIERLSGAEEDEEITINEVASRAGVGVGSLYDYFRDRKSLLAGVAAKITEDNIRAFERMLSESSSLPIRGLIERLVDFTFETYLGHKRLSRRILRIALPAGLLPTLADGQTRFAAVLADALSKRTDVDVGDGNIDHAAYVAVQSMMGIVGTSIWQDIEPLERDALRAELIRLFERYFTRAQ